MTMRRPTRSQVREVAHDLGLDLSDDEVDAYLDIMKGAMIAYDLPILFPIMFGLFDLFFVLALLDMLFTERRVEVEVGTLTFTKRMFAGGKRRTFRSEEIASIKPSRGMQSGSKLYYRIELKTREGKSHILASMLDNQRLARRIIHDFEAALAS